MVKNLPTNAGDSALIPGFRKTPWSRKWQPIPAFLPGKAHGQRSLVGYSPWGRKELDMTEATKQQQQRFSVLIQINMYIAYFYSFINTNDSTLFTAGSLFD